MMQLSEKVEPSAILSLLSRALPYYLNSWRNIDDTTGLFGTTDPQTFNMRSMGSSSPVIEYVIRPHVHILCILSAYLGNPGHFHHIEHCLSIDEAREKLNKGVRWMCETHLSGSRDVVEFLGRKRWGQNWRSSHWASLLGLCALTAQRELADDLLENVKRVVAFEADRFINILPPSGCEDDTKLEENALDTMVMAWAINLNPGHPNAASWIHMLHIWAINIASSINDKANHAPYCNKSTASWVSTQNIYPDMTAENHGFFHPELLTYSVWVVLSMAAYTMNGKEPPQCLHLKNHEETFDVLLPFCLPTGLFYAPGGQDLPAFIPRPFALAWGLWNNDPRASRLCVKLLSWMKQHMRSGPEAGAAGDGNQISGPWVAGFAPAYEGWELFFQSQTGFELALLAILPFPREFRFYSSGQMENAVDTIRVYPFVQFCFRRNTRTSRSIAWKTLDRHPVIGLAIHDKCELIMPFRASFLGTPALGDPIRNWEVAFHNDRLYKDGFDSWGRICYFNSSAKPVLHRDIRVLTWGDEGLVVFDEITADDAAYIEEQYLSPVYLVNDHWTSNSLSLHSGSLHETFRSDLDKRREVSCPSFWASVEYHFLFQLLWGREKGLHYIPGGERNAPPYWKNCRLDMLAVHVEPRQIARGETVYRIGFYAGAGKAPRPIKCTGNSGEFFRGLVIMDGKNTLGLS